MQHHTREVSSKRSGGGECCRDLLPREEPAVQRLLCPPGRLQRLEEHVDLHVHRSARHRFLVDHYLLHLAKLRAFLCDLVVELVVDLVDGDHVAKADGLALVQLVGQLLHDDEALVAADGDVVFVAERVVLRLGVEGQDHVLRHSCQGDAPLEDTHRLPSASACAWAGAHARPRHSRGAVHAWRTHGRARRPRGSTLLQLPCYCVQPRLVDGRTRRLSLKVLRSGRSVASLRLGFARVQCAASELEALQLERRSLCCSCSAELHEAEALVPPVVVVRDELARRNFAEELAEVADIVSSHVVADGADEHSTAGNLRGAAVATPDGWT
mmetsp:Transcript_19856/g.76080  ORF Transcript_19856/g.76080 Transcript_19856/m.76080 type:complete len:326 (-) Transcript_19856:1031-2008(-)